MGEVLVLQHNPVETLGTITEALAAVGANTRYVRAFEGQPVPRELGAVAGLIVMGGPMGIYEQDRYPFLKAEKRLVERAIEVGKPVLGVCLGSQMMASVLGAEVRAGDKKEIGWYTVTPERGAVTDALWSVVDRPFVGFHWHGDIFDLPRGAVWLASSEQTPYQAFRYGANAYGCLFHMEVTSGIIAGMVESFSDELCEAGLDGREIIAGAQRYLHELQAAGETVFGKWARLAVLADSDTA